MTGLLGPSGCGKSTLLRSIVGVQQTHGGAVQRARRAGRQRAAARPDRLRHPGGQRVRRPDRRREPAVLRPGARRRRRRGRPGRRRRRPRRPRATRSSASSAAASGPGPASRSPCSAAPTCSCSTSRPSASTRCCAGTSGGSSTSSPTPARRVLVSSHVMDEAERCDRLLLMRDGAILAARHARRDQGRRPAPTTSRRRSSTSWSEADRHERRGSRLAVAGPGCSTQLRRDHRTLAMLLVAARAC